MYLVIAKRFFPISTKALSNNFFVAQAATGCFFLLVQKETKEDVRALRPLTPLPGHKNVREFLGAPLQPARLKNTGIRSSKIKFHASQPVLLRFACGKLPACSQFKAKRRAPVFARGFKVSF
ncbi:MAG TPA: hypothetical protein VHO66_03790 [Ruminiclostridium sp.]|nr:hypothetical protein [Ruminiclostridium sp.]